LSRKKIIKVTGKRGLKRGSGDADTFTLLRIEGTQVLEGGGNMISMKARDYDFIEKAQAI